VTERDSRQVTYGVATVFQVYHYYAPTFLLFEATTLFVNVRWLLVELQLKDTKLYLYNGLALLLAWFVVRILWGYTSSFFFWLDTLAAYREASIRTPVMAWYMVANVSLNLLNTVWFFKIVKGAVKALSGGRK